MAKRIKGTKKWKKTGRVPRTVEYSYQVYKSAYDQYAKNNIMRDSKLTEREYRYYYERAKRLHESMNNFARNTAMQQRETSELQLKTTWKVLKERIEKIKKKSFFGEERTIEEEVLLATYGKMKFSEFRKDSKEAISLAKETVESRVEWNKIFEELFYPEESKRQA